MLDSWGPECRWVKARLDNSATTPFLGPSDAVFGNAVGLWHSSGCRGKSPMASGSGSHKLGRVIAIETNNFVFGTSKMVKRLNGMEGRFGRFGVGSQPLGGTIVHDYRDSTDGEVRIFVFATIKVLDEMVTRNLFSELGRSNTGVIIMSRLR